MSNDVYGYVKLRESAAVKALEGQLRGEAEKLGLGFSNLSPTDVYGLPDSLVPAGRCVCYRVTDRPASTNASYLADMVDYAPETEIGLPRAGRERLDLLIAWISNALDLEGVQAFVIVASDSNDVEGVVDLNGRDLRARLVADFAEYAPPNNAYVIHGGR